MSKLKIVESSIRRVKGAIQDVFVLILTIWFKERRVNQST